MSLQSYRVQDPGRAETCLSTGLVGTCTSVPKGLRAPSAPTAGWELVPLLSLLFPGCSQVQHPAQPMQSQTLSLGPSSHGLKYVSPTVPTDIYPHAGPCVDEQHGMCVSVLHAALTWGCCRLELAVQASIPET